MLHSLGSWWQLLPAGARKDREHLLYQRPALGGREITGVDGLFLALESTEFGLLGEVAVYNVDDGVDLFARKSFTTTK